MNFSHIFCQIKNKHVVFTKSRNYILVYIRIFTRSRIQWVKNLKEVVLVFWGVGFQVCYWRKLSTSVGSSSSTEWRQKPRLENSSMGNSGSKPSLIPSVGNMKSSMAVLCSVYLHNDQHKSKLLFKWWMNISEDLNGTYTYVSSTLDFHSRQTRYS